MIVMTGYESNDSTHTTPIETSTAFKRRIGDNRGQQKIEPPNVLRSGDCFATKIL